MSSKTTKENAIIHAISQENNTRHFVRITHSHHQKFVKKGNNISIKVHYEKLSSNSLRLVYWFKQLHSHFKTREIFTIGTILSNYISQKESNQIIYEIFQDSSSFDSHEIHILKEFLPDQTPFRKKFNQNPPNLEEFKHLQTSSNIFKHLQTYTNSCKIHAMKEFLPDHIPIEL